MDNEKLLSTNLPVPHAWSHLPEAASTHAEHVDWLFYYLGITGIILFLLVVGPMILFAFRYKRKHVGQRALSQKDHNTKLEVAWTVIPVIYLAVLFHWGFVGYTKIYEAPVNAKQLRITGKKWDWSVQYPDEDGNVEEGGVGMTLVVPVNQPVQLTMKSLDVIHSFFIPNFRVKQDVLPDRYTQLWFEATEIGEYPVFCAEYCGNSHSNMMAKIKVVSQENYQDWLDKKKNEGVGKSPAELGASLYKSKGCNVCHSVNGTPGVAPSFKGLYGHKVELADGTTPVADDTYIRKSIVEPNSQIVKGFAPVMPKIAISEKEIVAIIEFIKTLK
jgi:cytochrome c oxidase subunit 2